MYINIRVQWTKMFGSRDQHGVLQNECKIQNLIHFIFTNNQTK